MFWIGEITGAYCLAYEMQPIFVNVFLQLGDFDVMHVITCHIRNDVHGLDLLLAMLNAPESTNPLV